jgi:hypothetical protein
MNSEEPLVLLSRCMAPLIFDIDNLWSGCSDDAAFFARNKKRKFRLRNAFHGEFSEFGNAYQSALVIRLLFCGFRLRIGLTVQRRRYPELGEASSDSWASNRLADLCEEVEAANPSVSNGKIA